MSIFSGLGGDWLGVLGNIGSALIGGNLGQAGAKAQMRFNAEQARLNREFQREMSSTAHQRQVADLRKAGLNPILSASQGGATTPSGSQASTNLNPNEVMAHSAADLALKTAQTKKLNMEAEAGQYAAELSRIQARGLSWLEDQFKNSALSAGGGAAGVLATIMLGKNAPAWLTSAGKKAFSANQKEGGEGKRKKPLEIVVTGGQDVTPPKFKSKYAKTRKKFK